MAGWKLLLLHCCVVIFGLAGSVAISWNVSLAVGDYARACGGMLALLIAGYCAGYIWARSFESSKNRKRVEDE